MVKGRPLSVSLETATVVIPPSAGFLELTNEGLAYFPAGPVGTADSFVLVADHADSGVPVTLVADVSEQGLAVEYEYEELSEGKGGTCTVCKKGGCVHGTDNGDGTKSVPYDKRDPERKLQARSFRGREQRSTSRKRR